MANAKASPSSLNMPQKLKIEIPLKDRFTLAEALELLKPADCAQTDLFEYLRTGRLQAVCFPYRLEPDHEIPIEPVQWGRMWKDAWEFPVYHGWIGDKDYEGYGKRMPLHVVPDAVDADLTRKLADGKPAAESAVVYIVREELIHFAKWLENPSKSRRGRHRPGAGRPTKHDYSEIDECLETLFRKKGQGGFRRPSEVTTYLNEQLGELGLPPDTTLRNHINSWFGKRVRGCR